MSGRRRILFLVVAAALVAACGGTGRAEFDEEIQARGGGLGSALALESIAALQEELGDDLAFRSFTMTAGQVTIEVLVPGSTDEVDSYRYGTSGLYGGGGLSGPSPVPGVGDTASLRRMLFRTQRIAWDDLDRIVDDALAAADLARGYAQTVRVDRTGPRPEIVVNVTSPRQSVPVRFRADGTPVGQGDQ